VLSKKSKPNSSCNQKRRASATREYSRLPAPPFSKPTSSMEPEMDLYCQAMAEIPLSINPHILKALLDAYRIEEPDEEISETTIELTEDYLGTTPEELLKSAGHSFENGMEFFVEIGTDGNPHLIYADNNVSGIELVAEIIRRLLPPGEKWSLTWVYYGSKLRLHSYDGGGVRVTASGMCNAPAHEPKPSCPRRMLSCPRTRTFARTGKPNDQCRRNLATTHRQKDRATFIKATPSWIPMAHP